MPAVLLVGLTPLSPPLYLDLALGGQGLILIMLYIDTKAISSNISSRDSFT